MLASARLASHGSYTKPTKILNFSTSTVFCRKIHLVKTYYTASTNTRLANATFTMTRILPSRSQECNQKCLKRFLHLSKPLKVLQHNVIYTVVNHDKDHNLLLPIAKVRHTYCAPHMLDRWHIVFTISSYNSFMLVSCPRRWYS